MLQEVPVVCPRCESKRVESVVPGTCEIRHDGHYELMCKGCVSLVVDQMVSFNLEGVETRRTQTDLPNFKVIK